VFRPKKEGPIARFNVTRLAAVGAIFCISLQAQWITGFYEAGNDIEPISAIPWSKYTHVVHFAARPDGMGGVVRRWRDDSESRRIVSSRPAGKKVLLSIVDDGRNPTAFQTSTSPGLIADFVANIVKFVNRYGYDGVDIDWERNVDGAQCARLFRLLRQALPGKVIAADMNNNSESVSAAAQAWSSLDQLNIMCYDMDSPGNGYSWYNAPLFQNGNARLMTCEWRVNPFLKAGVPASRIGIGIPFYGRRWRGVDKALVHGDFSASTVLYRELITDPMRWQPQYRFYDERYKSNYLSIPALNEFDSYTGVEAIRDIAAWVKSKGFGGVMTYSLHYEYLPGRSGDARYPLSTAVYDAIN
jgi:chitinase